MQSNLLSGIINNVHAYLAHAARNAVRSVQTGRRGSGRKALEQLETRTFLSAVTASAFNIDTNPSPHNTTIEFDSDVSDSLSTDDLVLYNLSAGNEIARGNLSLSYNTGSNRATITSPVTSNQTISGLLPDANYEMILEHEGISGLLNDYNLGFFFKMADANHDRLVNGTDQAIMNANWTGTGKTFSQGDFNYDGTVNIGDSAILGALFNTQLPAPPDEPYTVTAGNQTSTSIQVGWSQPATACDGFHVYCSTDGVNFGDPIATVAYNGRFETDSYTDTGLTHGTKYWYRIRAYTNAAGNSATSNKAWAVTVLPAPSGLSTSSPATGGVETSWTNNATAATGFRIERSTTSNGTYTAVGTVGSSTTTFLDTSAAEDTTYYYRIVATNSVTESAASSYASATTVAVAAPSDLSVVADSSGAPVVSWQDNSNREAKYILEIASNSSFSSDVTTLELAENATSFREDPDTFDPSEAHYYRVTAETTSEEDSDSPTELAGVDPLPPTDLLQWETAGTGGNIVMHLRWRRSGVAAAGTTQNIDGFRIERATDKYFTQNVVTYLQRSSYEVSANTLTLDETLPALTTGRYWYRIRGRFDNGGGDIHQSAYCYTELVTESLTPTITVANCDLVPDPGLSTSGPDLFTQVGDPYTTGYLQIPVGMAVNVSAVGVPTDPRNSFNVRDDAGRDELMRSQVWWDFGDITATSRYNLVQGLTASHLFKSTALTGPINKITLNIRTPDDILHQTDIRYKLVESGRDTVKFVSGTASGTGNGNSASTAWNWTQLTQNLSSNSEIRLVPGTPISVPATFNIQNKTNILFTTSDTSSSTKPVIKGNFGAVREATLIDIDQSSLIGFDGIELRGKLADDATPGFWNNGMQYSGRSCYLNNVTFNRTYYSTETIRSDSNVDLSDRKKLVTGLTILDTDTGNATSSDHTQWGGTGEYFVWASDASDFFLMGNTIGDTKVRNHNIRTLISRINVIDNRMYNKQFTVATDFDQDTLRANAGTYIGWQDNDIYDGRLYLGAFSGGLTSRPLQHTSFVVVEGNRQFTSTYPQADRYQWGVGYSVDNNTFTHWSRIVNNYIEGPAGTQDMQSVNILEVQGEHAIVAHNTLVAQQTVASGFKAMAIRFVDNFGSGRGHVLRGNLTRRVGASDSNGVLLTRQNTTAVNFFAATDGVRDNVWPTSPASKFFDQVGITGTPTEIPFATWQSDFAGGEDALTNVPFQSSTPAGYTSMPDDSSADVGIRMIEYGIRDDADHALRPPGTSAVWTAGAVQRTTSAPDTPSLMTKWEDNPDEWNLSGTIYRISWGGPIQNCSSCRMEARIYDPMMQTWGDAFTADTIDGRYTDAPYLTSELVTWEFRVVAINRNGEATPSDWT